MSYVHITNMQSVSGLTEDFQKEFSRTLEIVRDVFEVAVLVLQICLCSVVNDAETARPTNICNPNYVWEVFKKTDKGYGVSDDSNAFTDALIKSIGVAGRLTRLRVEPN